MACFHISERLEMNDVTDNGDVKLAPYAMFFASDQSNVSTPLNLRQHKCYGTAK